MMTQKIVKSHVSSFSPGELNVGINTWGLCTAIEMSPRAVAGVF